MKNKTIVISLGGSIIVSDQGIDIDSLKKFRKFIISKVKEGYKFIIIVGGGYTARSYISAVNAIIKTNRDNSDWVGIMATRLNAQIVKTMFHPYVKSDIIINPNTKIKKGEKIVIGAGYKPGWSTDYDAVLLAINNDISTVINLSNIDYVYNKNPKKYKDAKKISNMSWDEFKKIVGNKWKPGLNLPFDPIASKKAAQAGLEVVIMNGKDIGNLNRYFQKKKFKGTIIK